MVSVIVPIYKVEAYLEKCIESIRNQTYCDMEIILVDDGSPDGCGEICDKYQKLDERIKVLHKENGGLSDARNAGLDVAVGEYILFVDSDDYIHPQMLEILYHNLQETNADISVCGFKEVEEREEVFFNSIKEQDSLEIFEGQEVMNQLQYKNTLTVVAWNKLYRKELFADNRYPKGKIHEDEFLIHHILDLCKRSVYTKEELYYYVHRTGSIMGQINWSNVANGWEAYEERLAFLERHQYSQMALWTKLQMLHYVCKFYSILHKNPKTENFLYELRKRFCILYRERDVKKELTKEQSREYKYFVINPWLYYNSKRRKERGNVCKQFLKQKIREFIKK